LRLNSWLNEYIHIDKCDRG